MSKQFTILLLCMAVSAPAFSQNQQPYDVAAGLKLPPSYQEAQAERLRQEQMRLENQRLQQEIELRRQEQLRFQNETRERERARAAEMRKQTNVAAQSASSDTYEQLRAIGQLRDDGILTEEEFRDLKKKILDEIDSSPATKDLMEY